MTTQHCRQVVFVLLLIAAVGFTGCKKKVAAAPAAPAPVNFDKSDIRPDQVARLEANASWLKQHRGVKFTIEGHCDERGSAEYNLGLGDRRANRVKEFLIKEGVDSSSIRTISYGKERPVCREATEDCYQRNRRAAFVPSPIS